MYLFCLYFQFLDIMEKIAGRWKIDTFRGKELYYDLNNKGSIGDFEIG